MRHYGGRPLSEVGVWLGAIGLILLIGTNGILQGGSGRRRGPGVSGSGKGVQAVGVPERWMGFDLPRGLGELKTLEGDSAGVGGYGLRVWMVIRDMECISCIEEIPFISSLLDSLDIDGLDAVTVALGDRHEARRTLWGVDAGMPVRVSDHAELLQMIGVDVTPLRIVTWHGRIVGLSGDTVLENRGLSLLLELLHRWSG
jgi:hypothetical protein